MPRFETLIKYIPELENVEYGDWVIDRENDGTPEHPIHMPYVNYSKIVMDFRKDVYDFTETHKELQLNRYREILEKNGLRWDFKVMEEADVSSMDAQCVMAMIMGAIRAERFCDGALLDFFENGCILCWLQRLKEFDEK